MRLNLTGTKGKVASISAKSALLYMAAGIDWWFEEFGTIGCA
jgi:hypothetical protein